MIYETAAVLVLILSTGLKVIYNHRKENKRTSAREVREELEELEALCGLLRLTRDRKLREAGSRSIILCK